jgi:hypothetical protein
MQARRLHFGGTDDKKNERPPTWSQVDGRRYQKQEGLCGEDDGPRPFSQNVFAYAVSAGLSMAGSTPSRKPIRLRLR